MGDVEYEEYADADVDHGTLNSAASFILADQAAPAGHQTEGSLHHPATKQRLEVLLAGQFAYHLGDEAMIGNGIH